MIYQRESFFGRGKAGFVLPLIFSRRSGPVDVAKVLMLQGQRGEVTWGSCKDIIPIRALLNDSIILPDNLLAQDKKAEIVALLEEVAREFL